MRENHLPILTPHLLIVAVGHAVRSGGMFYGGKGLTSFPMVPGTQ
jgi:hypothetical protein